MNSIDLGRAFKTPFADPRWVNKSLMAFVWVILLVTIPAVTGAQLEYIKSVSEGREELPEWSDFGTKWINGFLLGIGGAIYMAPVWLVGIIFMVPGIIAAAAGSSDSGTGLFTGGMCLYLVFVVIYALAAALFLYGAIVNFALKGNFGAMFAFGEIMGHIRDGSGYFTAWLYALIISFAMSFITGILGVTIIGYLAVPSVIFLTQMMMAHVFGQWAARSYGITPVAAPAYGMAGGGYAPPGGGYTPPAPPSYTPPAPPSYTPPAPPSYNPPPPAPPSAPTPPAPPAPPAPPGPGA